MSAATTIKPRAKAKPKAEKDGLQSRLDSIFAGLKTGQEKLQLAHQSVGMTDPGEAPEILLRTITEDMLPAALAPIYRQPLTRADVAAAYTAMFPSLAAIEGVIALSRDQVIESTLREALALLDEANSMMDLAGTPGLPESAEPADRPAAPLAQQVSQDTPEGSKHHAPSWLTFEKRDNLLRRLHYVHAAVSMLLVVFANDPDIGEPKKAIEGLVGVLQYARRLLDAIHEDVCEDGAEIDDLYWSTYAAQSLVALLEEIEWADAFRWEVGESMVFDCLDAARDNIARATAYLELSEVQA